MRAGFPHSPVPIWNVVHGWLEAVCVVTLVTAITQQQLLLMVPAVAELAVLWMEEVL